MAEIYNLIYFLNAVSTSLALKKTITPKAITQVFIPPCSHVVR